VLGIAHIFTHTCECVTGVFAHCEERVAWTCARMPISQPRNHSALLSDHEHCLRARPPFGLTGLRHVIVVNMRWDLSHWKRARESYMSKHGGRPWVLRWRSRGVALKHTVSEHDVTEYGAVPMDSVRELRDMDVKVLVVYGCAASGNGLAIDGAVPVEDVASTVNALAGACELRMVPNAGHNVREEGAVDRLFDAVCGWLVNAADTRKDSKL
jgi:hypothetical protein